MSRFIGLDPARLTFIILTQLPEQPCVKIYDKSGGGGPHKLPERIDFADLFKLMKGSV